MNAFNAERELNFKKWQAPKENKTNPIQTPHPRTGASGVSALPPPRSWCGPLTCSFSEYGLLRTTGTWPLPHRSLKTRSFSMPRDRGLCDLPSRSLKGKAGEVRKVPRQESPAGCPGLEVLSQPSASTMHLRDPMWRRLALHAHCCFVELSAMGGKAAPLSNPKVSSPKLA